MERNRTTDWSLVAGIGLVVLGVWLLGQRLLGSAWEPLARLVRFLTSVAWPIVVIAAGVMLIVAARRGTLHAPAAGTRLYRSRSDRMLTGVLAGVGHYLGLDPTWVRIAYVILTLATSFFPALVAYIIATVIIPEEPVASPGASQWQSVPTPPAPPVPPAPTPPAPPAPTPPEPPAPAAPEAPEPPKTPEA
jgi:phage shock protein C